jgi:phosphoribosylpyrophosphate synthetase
MTNDIHYFCYVRFWTTFVNGAPLIADYFIEHGIQGDDVVVVSPDHGGVTRARKLAASFNAFAAREIVPAVSIMSSIKTHVLPST